MIGKRDYWKEKQHAPEKNLQARGVVLVVSAQPFEVHQDRGAKQWDHWPKHPSVVFLLSLNHTWIDQFVRFASLDETNNNYTIII